MVAIYLETGFVPCRQRSVRPWLVHAREGAAPSPSARRPSRSSCCSAGTQTRAGAPLLPISAACSASTSPVTREAPRCVCRLRPPRRRLPWRGAWGGGRRSEPAPPCDGGQAWIDDFFKLLQPQTAASLQVVVPVPAATALISNACEDGGRIDYL